MTMIDPIGAAAAWSMPTLGAGDGFAAALERASASRPVTVARGAGVRLSEEQMSRLTSAADRAERAGATRAIVLLDGMALRLDVTLREVTGTADLSRPGVLTGIDSVVTAGGAAGAGVGARAERGAALSRLIEQNAGQD